MEKSFEVTCPNCGQNGKLEQYDDWLDKEKDVPIKLEASQMWGDGVSITATCMKCGYKAEV